MSNHKLFVISGPSGTGKTSTMRELMRNEIVSFTTRKKRVGEVDGVDYYFTDEETVNQLEEKGLLVERVRYGGNSYGITQEEITEKLKHEDAFVIVDINGYHQIQKLYDNVISIFFKIPLDEAKERMKVRGDLDVQIEARLQTYQEEMNNQMEYDYVITNEEDNQDKTKRILKTIMFD